MYSHADRFKILDKESTATGLVLAVSRYSESKYRNWYQEGKSWIGASLLGWSREKHVSLTRLLVFILILKLILKTKLGI